MDEVTGKKAGNRSENTVTRETTRTHVSGRNIWGGGLIKQSSGKMITDKTVRTKVFGRNNWRDRQDTGPKNDNLRDG